MGQWTNSNICQTVTDGPFCHANMSRCTFDPKKNPYWCDVTAVVKGLPANGAIQFTVKFELPALQLVSLEQVSLETFSYLINNGTSHEISHSQCNKSDIAATGTSEPL